VTTAYHRTLIALPERCKLVYVSRASKIPDIRRFTNLVRSDMFSTQPEKSV
jgi:hypothetical protein